MLTWPRAGGDWGERLPAAESTAEEIAVAVGRHQPLCIAVPDAATASHLRSRLQTRGVGGGHLHLYVAPANDIWARDHGPITVLAGDTPRCLDFRFNGWGGKYPAAEDDRLTARLHAAGAFPGTTRQAVERVLEGGAIDSDGAGTILTTRRCLLHPERNPDMDVSDYEQLFREQLGASRTLWLEHGWLDGDDTDGHVDMLARFTDTGTITYTACDRPDDPHFQHLQAMAAELTAFRTPDGAPYRLVPLPWPEPVHDTDGARLPASYANFLIINGAVLVPTYGVPQDTAARQTLAGLFPEREIIGIDARTLISQGGALHCATMQLPAAPGTATETAI
ncbi:agmatine deiminase [Aquisalimonas asiatica]|uniref:Agmatine deiminase n=2 Tax=Aquisalimonas asiatica TaxID=406100 RepID=A0A1H8QFB1_9GAMM|nr:agmatine deiminase [Aquisalimonas asiatica]